MPTAIDWSPTVDPSEVARLTTDALAAGQAVVLPGDAGYLALWTPNAGIALPDVALLVWGPNEAAALGVSVPPAARRLMFRAWPAPRRVAPEAQKSYVGAPLTGGARRNAHCDDRFGLRGSGVGRVFRRLRP